jgi:hypothetical protein
MTAYGIIGFVAKAATAGPLADNTTFIIWLALWLIFTWGGIFAGNVIAGRWRFRSFIRSTLSKA